MVTALVVRQVIVVIVLLQAVGAIGITVKRERQLVAHGEQPLPSSTYLALILRMPIRALGVYLIAPTSWAFTTLWSILGYIGIAYVLPIALCFVIENLIFAMLATIATKKELKKQAEELRKQNEDAE